MQNKWCFCHCLINHHGLGKLTSLAQWEKIHIFGFDKLVIFQKETSEIVFVSWVWSWWLSFEYNVVNSATPHKGNHSNSDFAS
jgi:hypothetical protein